LFEKINKIDILYVIFIISFNIGVFIFSPQFIKFLLIIDIVMILGYRFVLYGLSKKYTFIKNNKVFHYFIPQDRRWANIKYGVSTIGETGCGLAVLAMIESSINPNTSPVEVKKWVDEKYPDAKFGTGLEIMSEYIKHIGFECEFLSKDCDIKSELKSDTIICVLYRSDINNMHYVILYENKENKAQIADSADFLRTVTSVNLDNLLNKVPTPEEIKYPYILIKI